MSDDRLGLAFELERTGSCPIEQWVHLPASGFRDEHTTRLGGCLKPGGCIHGVAYNAVFNPAPRPYLANHHLSGVNASAHGEVLNTPT